MEELSVMDSQELKVAVVTGAGSGIGRHSSLALLNDGYGVALVGRRQEALEETAAFAGADAKCLILPADISNPQQVCNVFEQLRTQFGRIDVLFNNAGCNAPPIPMEELTLEQWQRVVDVNLTGMFFCTQHAIRMMKDQDPSGGRIINNGSISAHVPRPNSAAYTATKHAVTGFTKSVALDGRRFDIACGQIDIGNASTPMTVRMKEGVLQPDYTTAAEPTIDADHIANAVLYMANLPLDTNVLTMTVMATQMPFLGRG